MTYGKVPPIERGYEGTGLKGECAYMWALFLQNEADMSDDQINYSKWTAIVEQLEPKEGKPMPSMVLIGALEEELKKYNP